MKGHERRNETERDGDEIPERPVNQFLERTAAVRVRVRALARVCDQLSLCHTRAPSHDPLRNAESSGLLFHLYKYDGKTVLFVFAFVGKNGILLEKEISVVTPKTPREFYYSETEDVSPCFPDVPLHRRPRIS